MGRSSNHSSSSGHSNNHTSSNEYTKSNNPKTSNSTNGINNNHGSSSKFFGKTINSQSIYNVYRGDYKKTDVQNRNQNDTNAYNAMLIFFSALTIVFLIMIYNRVKTIMKNRNQLLIKKIIYVIGLLSLILCITYFIEFISPEHTINVFYIAIGFTILLTSYIIFLIISYYKKHK